MVVLEEVERMGSGAGVALDARLGWRAELASGKGS